MRSTAIPSRKPACSARSWPARQGRRWGCSWARTSAPSAASGCSSISSCSVGYFNDVDVYVDGNPAFANQRAGSNDSDRDDFITGSGLDSFYRLRLKYLLPIGSGRDQVLPAYQLSDGLLASGESGGTAWNPLSSGRTFLELRPFYRTQNIANDDIDEEQSTNGLEFAVFWDNRDYPHNPSRGNALTLKLTRDWGLADSTTSWTSLSAEYDQYIRLGKIEGFRQSVLALDFWTAYSPTWDVQADGRVAHKPPGFLGAHLGGLFRMRAYPSQRFSDKAAVYYAAELRMVPTWNFFDSLPWLQERMGVEWIQFVGFAELGRVAPRYALRELHRDMRWDLGLGAPGLGQGPGLARGYRRLGGGLGRANDGEPSVSVLAAHVT